MLSNYVKLIIKWLLGIFLIFLGGIFLIPPINEFINTKLSHIKVVQKTNDWGRFFIAFVISIFLINTFVPAPKNQKVDNLDTQNSSVSAVKVETNKYLEDKNTEKIANDLKISIEKASKIYEILVDCGVKDIDYLEKMDGKDVLGYFVFTSSANNPVRLGLNKNYSVDMVIYDTWILYENGKNKDNLKNYTISNDDMQALKLLSMQNIRACLDYPDTAKFNGDWKATRMDNDFTLSSSLKYKNSFNMELSSPFNVQYKKENDNYKMTFLSIDNKVFFKEKTAQTSLSAKDKKEIKEIERLMGL